MNRRLSGFAVAFVLGGLAVVAVAATGPVTPASGTFNGLTSQKGETSLSVSKAGAGRKVELKTMAVKFSCNFPEGSGVQIVSAISFTSFKENQKGPPLPVKNWKFSYEGPLYIGSGAPAKIDFSGSFKSATKVVGKDL